MFKYLKATFGQVSSMKSKTKPLHTLILNISRHNRNQTKGSSVLFTLVSKSDVCKKVFLITIWHNVLIITYRNHLNKIAREKLSYECDRKFFLLN